MNKLIVFEGIDGVGKTTLARMLVERLSYDETPAVFYEDHHSRSILFEPLKQEVRIGCSIETHFIFIWSQRFISRLS
jgi:thymidylate kinase